MIPEDKIKEEYDKIIADSFDETITLQIENSELFKDCSKMHDFFGDSLLKVAKVPERIVEINEE